MSQLHMASLGGYSDCCKKLIAHGRDSCFCYRMILDQSRFLGMCLPSPGSGLGFGLQLG